MSRKFAFNLDLLTNQLLQACLENLASAPTHKAGRVYFDTVLGYARVSDGASWGRASFITDPFARANHTGTQLAATISDFDTQVRTNRLDQLANPTASVNFNNQKGVNVLDPTNPQDIATKAYVDAARQGLDVKASVRAASTATVVVTYSATSGTSGRGQITAAPNTLDGLSLALNDRILLKDQSTGAQNGIWVVSTLGSGANGVWDRATDFDADAEVTAGAFTFVTEGTVNDNSGWVLTTNDPIVIGGASGTALAFAQFSGAGQITAGAGLTKSGNTLDVGAGTGISVAADSVGVDTAVVVRKFAQDIGDGVATAFVVTHSLGTRDVTVAVYDNSTPWAEIETENEHTSTTTVTVRFVGLTPTSNQYRVVVHA